MRFHIITVVWGEKFTSIFTEIALPNQLSSGNLPAFNKLESVYRIYTTTEDLKRIQQSLCYIKLLNTLPVEIVFIDEADTVRENKYALMTKCHKLAMRKAKEDKAALVFLAPDVVYSDGSFANLLKIAVNGKRIVVNAVLRVKKESFVPSLLEQFYSAKDKVIRIGSEKLVELMLMHLHPLSRSFQWDSPQFNGWPAQIYFEVKGEGLLARCFMLHPLMVNVHRENLAFKGALDTNYLYKLHPREDDIYVVTDSDEILMVEMSDALENSDKIFPNVLSARKVAVWAGYYTDPYHRKFIKYKIRFHYGARSFPWLEIEKLSDELVKKIFLWYKFERTRALPNRLFFRASGLIRKAFQQFTRKQLPNVN